MPLETKMVRRLDTVGRIVLPFEFRNSLGWDMSSEISIILQGNTLVLQKCQDDCLVSEKISG